MDSFIKSVSREWDFLTEVTEVTDMVNGGTEIQTQAVWIQSLHSQSIISAVIDLGA